MLKILLVVALFVLATYLLMRVIERRGLAPRPQRPRARPPARPLGPDDDPDFLRDLNRRSKPKPEVDPEPPAE